MGSIPEVDRSIYAPPETKKIKMTGERSPKSASKMTPLKVQKIESPAKP
jgi:hypothetical protein